MAMGLGRGTAGKGQSSKSGGTPDAGQSRCSAVSPVGSGVLSTVTITVLDSGGVPLSGVSVTIAVSGSTNTVNQPSATTNASGVTTGSFSSTTLETKTVTATAGGVVINQKPSVVVQSGPSAWLLEDFSTYTSTANYISDPRGIYSTGEDVLTSQIFLDTSVFAPGLSQSVRYDFPARNGVCTDYTIGRNINFPADVSEVWVEVIAKFQNTWTTVMSGCSSSNPDYKFLFGRVRTSGRFNIMMGTSVNLLFTVGYPAGEDNFEGGNAGQYFDGNFHTHRWHMKVGVSGACKYWVDGVVVKDYGVVDMASNQVYGLAMGRNINQGPPSAQSMWYGKITLYNSDPGWG